MFFGLWGLSDSFGFYTVKGIEALKGVGFGNLGICGLGHEGFEGLEF